MKNISFPNDNKLKIIKDGMVVLRNDSMAKYLPLTYISLAQSIFVKFTNCKELA